MRSSVLAKTKTDEQQVLDEFLDIIEGDSDTGELLEAEYGRDELSLLDYPIAFLSRRQLTEEQLKLRKQLCGDTNPDPYTIELREKRRLPSGKVVEAVYQMRAKDRSVGFPTASANRTWVALVSIAKRANGFSENPARFSEKDLIEERGNEVTPHYKKLCRQDIERLRNLDIRGKYTFWDAKERKIAEVETRYSPIADYRMVSVDARISPDDADKPLSWIQFGEAIYSNLQNGGVKRINKAEYHSIKPDFDQQLYRFLDKRRNSRHVRRTGVLRCDFVTTVYHKLGEGVPQVDQKSDGTSEWNHRKARQKVRRAVRGFRQDGRLGIRDCAFKIECDPMYDNEPREALYFYFDTQQQLELEAEAALPDVLKPLVERGLMRERDATDIWTKKWDFVSREARLGLQAERDNGLDFEQYLARMVAFFEHERATKHIKKPKNWIKAAIRDNYTDEAFEKQQSAKAKRVVRETKEAQRRRLEEEESKRKADMSAAYDARFARLPEPVQERIRVEATKLFEASVTAWERAQYEKEREEGKRIDDMKMITRAAYLKFRNQLMDAPDFAG